MLYANANPCFIGFVVHDICPCNPFDTVVSWPHIWFNTYTFYYSFCLTIVKLIAYSFHMLHIWYLVHPLSGWYFVAHTLYCDAFFKMFLNAFAMLIGSTWVKQRCTFQSSTDLVLKLLNQNRPFQNLSYSFFVNQVLNAGKSKLKSMDEFRTLISLRALILNGRFQLDQIHHLVSF